MRCVRLAIKKISNVRTVQGEALNDFDYDLISQRPLPMPLIFTNEQGGRLYGIEMVLQLEDDSRQAVRLDNTALKEVSEIEIVIRTRVVYAGTDEEVPGAVKVLPHSNRKLNADGSGVICARLLELSSKRKHKGQCFQLVMYPELNEAAITYLQQHVACDFFGEVLTYPIRVMSKCTYIPKSRMRPTLVDEEGQPWLVPAPCPSITSATGFRPSQDIYEYTPNIAPPGDYSDAIVNYCNNDSNRSSSNNSVLPSIVQLQLLHNQAAGVCGENNSNHYSPDHNTLVSASQSLLLTPAAPASIAATKDQCSAHESSKNSSIGDDNRSDVRSEDEEDAHDATRTFEEVLRKQVDDLRNELLSLQIEHETTLEHIALESLRHEALTHNLTYLRASLPYFMKQFSHPEHTRPYTGEPHDYIGGGDL